jgi:membrane glycosyltransferase
MLAGIEASGYGDRFHLYVLSDTNDAGLAAIEETRFSDFAGRWRDRIAVTYRRRTLNTGYKAGNIRDFCERWGDKHEFAVTLTGDITRSSGSSLSANTAISPFSRMANRNDMF